MLDLQDAITLFEEGDPRKAADLLEKLAAEMPGYATARVLLARSYERLNEWEPAIRAWREANQIIPNSPVVRRGLERAARKTASRSPIQPTRESGALPEPAEPGRGPAEPHERAEPAPRADPTHRPGPQPQYRAEPQPEPEPEAQRRPEPEAQAEPAPEAQAEPEAEPEPELEPKRLSWPEREFPKAPEIEASDAADEAVDLDEAGASQPETAEPEPAEPEPETAEPETAEPEPETAEHEPAEPEEADARRGRDFEDLDRLISELESARIVPRPDLDDLPPPDLEDDIEDVVSETLARIYASQGQYDEAAHVYELLAGQQPEKAEEFRDKASEMRSRASEQE